MSRGLDCRQAGVDIDEAERAVDLISSPGEVNPQAGRPVRYRRFCRVFPPRYRALSPPGIDIRN